MPDPVPLETIRAVLAKAQRSPSGGNTQPWNAVVLTGEPLAELTAKEAFGRAAEPWEVANVIVFLASDYASYMTGEVLSVSSQRA